PQRRQLTHPAPGHEVRHVARPRLLELEMHGHGVAAEPEEHALPERQHPSLPPCQADADGDDRKTEVLGQQVQPEVAEHRRRSEERQGHAGEDEGTPPPGPPAAGRRVHVVHVRALDRSTNIPCGRSCRKATMARNTTTLARLAWVPYSTNALMIPRENAARMAPRSCPSPPTITTRKASMM